MFQKRPPVLAPLLMDANAALSVVVELAVPRVVAP